MIKNNIHKKFSDELIAYFRLVRKRHVEKFFYCFVFVAVVDTQTNRRVL
jgi:hypothetical protein